MILVIPYSHQDICQALRLMKWIGWLSLHNGFSMKKEKVLLVPSQSAAKRSKHGEICGLAAFIFGEARCFLPEGEHEVGWPGSPNWMFRQALEHVERNFHDDMMLLEPDAIPTRPEWYDEIRSEWEVAKGKGKRFMGAFVPIGGCPHMTGNAVYGANWREVAPSLVSCPDASA